jgi:hypothetical protein
MVEEGWCRRKVQANSFVFNDSVCVYVTVCVLYCIP